MSTVIVAKATVYDKGGKALTVGSPVKWGKMAGRVVSLAPTFVRIKADGGTVFTRKPWAVRRAA